MGIRGSHECRSGWKPHVLCVFKTEIKNGILQMNVQEILKNHLKSIGADGLCCDGCGCGIDDLFPCDKTPSECKPAKKGIAEESGEFYEVGDEIFIEMEESKMTDVKPSKKRVRKYLTEEQSKASVELLDSMKQSGFHRLSNSLWVYLRSVVPQAVFNSADFNSDNPISCYVEWDDGDVDPLKESKNDSRGN
jgi:hypothetical protein